MSAVAHDPNWRTRLGLLALLLAAFALRIVALDRLGLAYDEAASALMARATPLEIITFHWNAAFEHPPLWILLVHGWSWLAGQSEFALRLLPAFAGTLLVAMTWRLAHTILPEEPRLPALSAILIALAPVLVYYSQEARMYTLVVLLLLVSLYLVLRLLKQPSWKLVFALWLVNWNMLGLHYYAALGLVIQALVIVVAGLVTSPTHTLPWGKLLVAFAGSILPLLAWMYFSPGFRTTLDVVLEEAEDTGTSWQFFLSDLWRELSFGSIRWQAPLAGWGLVIAPLVGIGALIIALRSGTSWFARTGGWMVIALALLPILSGALALRTLAPRYILWVVPMCYLLIAVLATAQWRRHWLAGVGVMLVVIGVDLLALQHYLGPYRKSEYREMTAYVQSHGDPQQELFLMEAPRQHLLARYYLPPQWQLQPMPTLPLPPYWPVTAPLIVPEDEDDRILGWLAERKNLWVSYTSEAEVDAGEFLAKYLNAVAYREHCRQWLDIRLCHYISPHALMPVDLGFTPTLFGNELALLGGKGSFYEETPGMTSLLVQLDWHALQKPNVDYKVSLRLVGEDGSIVVQADEYPIGPLLVPTTWNADDYKPGYFALTLPAGLPAGRYQLQAGLYDANTLAPTPHTELSSTPSSNPPASDPTTLAEVSVDGTMTLQPAR